MMCVNTHVMHACKFLNTIVSFAPNVFLYTHHGRAWISLALYTVWNATTCIFVCLHTQYEAVVHENMFLMYENDFSTRKYVLTALKKYALLL